jgi:prepilin-type N-terminal cleavage/methylation domain-containing protein
MIINRSHRVPNRAGFTLVELMVVVTIMAVLAALAAVAFGRLTRRSRLSEAITFFATVAGAQAQYWSDWGIYCGTDATPPFDGYDPPANLIAGRRTEWNAPLPAWGQCNFTLPGVTWFQYVVVSGDGTTNCIDPPNNVCPSPQGTVAIPACEAILGGGPNPPGSHWWYVVARADQTDDGCMSVLGTSFGMPVGLHWSVDGYELE